MKLRKTRYFYNFQWNLAKHLHFYKSLQNVCKETNIDIELITFIRIQDYFKQTELIRELRRSKCHVFLTFDRNITSIIYFFFVVLFHKMTLIHFKQTDPGQTLLLKKIFKNKLIFVTDLEGDKISEREFILKTTQNNNLSNDAKEKVIEGLLHEERLLISKFDHIFVYNEFFKELLIKRHPILKSEIIVSHLMSFVKNDFYFDERIRIEFRNKLNWIDYPIITYIGNVYYPWQNLSKTIKIFSKIKNQIHQSAKLLLLINRNDHSIANKFIEKYSLDKSDYILMEVPNNEILGYLNASDLGIVLRDFHPMNKVVTSGKLLDYLGCGLPVITTSILLNFQDNTKVYEYGLVLENLDIDNIPINKISEKLNYNPNFRKEISLWANENLSLNVLSTEYLNLLKMLSK